MWKALFVVSLFGMGLCFSCVAAADTSSSITSPSEAISLGEDITSKFMVALKGELVKAMKAGGPTNAISVCNEKAMPITAKEASSHKAVLELKRTSFQVRNPLNAPTKRESQALTYFSSKAKAGEPLPPYLIQQDKDSYSFYKPMKVGGVCLSCHGKSDVVAPEVLKLLKEKYPEDAALGYEEGDFRGVIKIRFKRK